ncbi:uncharacterized protein B0I36DRAFT_357048 [Microdochium trichocladiopsis]|uniref:Methyltransferase domain-containing protein n=1 Tax=Microdochium trichocladiopsis TaxID=1682393 RepID=A0A9P8YI31_9PEZI|nr:uncharacterized protein B0I36DRAFT_357048 [Microdochium trichocladiopsis]KAH7039646.1 hypothetical protein B0I36DRAFT_357048 [Microdochium trichocladiopsis]
MADPSMPDAKSYVTHVQRDLSVVPKLFSDILTHYSGIPPAQQAAHIIRIRDAAYTHCPYPCIGNFRYLGLDLAAHPAYTEHVLAPLLLRPPQSAGSAPAEPEHHGGGGPEGDQTGQQQQIADDRGDAPIFLDVGTCFGQDVRKLIYDGADPARIYASDVSRVLIDHGFELFQDEGRLSRDHFLCPGNMLLTSPEDIARDKLTQLHDKVSILHITTVFHLFPLEQQKAVADRCLRLLRKDIPADAKSGPALILGGQVGNAQPGHFLRKSQKHFSHMYRHDVQSWQDMWDEVAARPEWKARISKLDVQSRLVKRVMDHEAGTITFPQPSEADLVDKDGGSAPLWHQFEVRVVFDH